MASPYIFRIDHHGGISFTITLNSRRVLKIVKTLEGSGIEREVSFSDLPKEVQDIVLKEFEK